MEQIKGQAMDIKRNNFNLIPGKRGWSLCLLISQIIKLNSKHKTNVSCPFFKCGGIQPLVMFPYVSGHQIEHCMEGNSISALTVSSPDTRCSCSPRGRNHKYFLWLQSKVLSVSRLFFSSPGENIWDSASLKLYNVYIGDDITHFPYIYFRKSVFNALLCFAVPLPSWYKELQHRVPSSVDSS